MCLFLFELCFFLFDELLGANSILLPESILRIFLHYTRIIISNPILYLIIIVYVRNHQKQIVMSFSHTPTVTGHTLKPRERRRSVWAVKRVAMLRNSLPISILTFQSLYPITLDLWVTFWSKVCWLPSSFHMQDSPPITFTLVILG